MGRTAVRGGTVQDLFCLEYIHTKNNMIELVHKTPSQSPGMALKNRACTGGGAVSMNRTLERSSNARTIGSGVSARDGRHYDCCYSIGPVRLTIFHFHTSCPVPPLFTVRTGGGRVCVIRRITSRRQLTPEVGGDEVIFVKK